MFFLIWKGCNDRADKKIPNTFNAIYINKKYSFICLEYPLSCNWVEEYNDCNKKEGIINPPKKY